MSDNTVKLHRVLKTTPERLYRAFLDAEAMCKWLPPTGSPVGSIRLMQGSGAHSK